MIIHWLQSSDMILRTVARVCAKRIHCPQQSQYVNGSFLLKIFSGSSHSEVMVWHLSAASSTLQQGHFCFLPWKKSAHIISLLAWSTDRYHTPFYSSFSSCEKRGRKLKEKNGSFVFFSGGLGATFEFQTILQPDISWGKKRKEIINGGEKGRSE